jgi:23S rRNA (cytosine1962-C5)-methyltransferase
VRAVDGRFLGWGVYNSQSQITTRIWSWVEQQTIGPELIRARIHAAVAARRALLPDVDAVRLVFGESDGLPGVIVDRYGSVLVIQLTSSGADRWRDALLDELWRLGLASAIYERSDSEVMALEGLAPRSGWLRGEDARDVVEVSEHGLRFAVNVRHGQKTGFYLDQRDNRLRVRSLAAGRELLDCFCYTGGFALNALAGGACRVIAVESSAESLALARQNAARNAYGDGAVDWIQDDAFRCLRAFRDGARRFDLIVLDPPKFAPTAALAERAARAYKDINLLAFKLLRAGGLLVTFSCSGGVNRALFQKILAGAAADAGIHASIVAHLGATCDHPTALEFPESEYLKGFVIQVIDNG